MTMTSLSRAPRMPLLVLLSSLTGCGGGDVDFDPRTNSGLILAETAEEQQALAVEMVDVMITAPGECWDASVIVGGAQPTGIVSQWQFSVDEVGNVRYRFVGFDTRFGTVLLRAIGRYDGLPTAIVETWTGDVEAFVVVSPAEIVHVSVSPGGGLSTVRYGTHRGACL